MSKVCVRKRGTVWEYYFETAKSDGKRGRYYRSGFKTQKEALSAGAKAYAEYNLAGLTFTPSEISVGDYLDFWVKTHCEVELKPETVKNYVKRIKYHIKPALGRYRLRTVTPAVLQSFIYDKFNAGYSRNTVATIKGILSQAFLYAVEPLKLIQTSPMVYVRLPGPRAKAQVETRTNPHEYLPQETIAKVFERFPEKSTAHIPMMFAYKAGTRLGESFAFCWEDVNFEKGTIRVARQVQWDETNSVWYMSDPKYDSFRTIDLDSEFLELLQRERARQERAKEYYAEYYTHLYINQAKQINTQKDGEELHLICVRENGTFITPRVMQHTSRVIHLQLGIPEFDMHSLRVTHATLLAEKGVEPKYLQERMGHKNIVVTLQIYTRLSERMREKGRTIVQSIFANNDEN